MCYNDAEDSTNLDICTMKKKVGKLYEKFYQQE